jgi:hypothetical protein
VPSVQTPGLLERLMRMQERLEKIQHQVSRGALLRRIAAARLGVIGGR